MSKILYFFVLITFTNIPTVWSFDRCLQIFARKSVLAVDQLPNLNELPISSRLKTVIESHELFKLGEKYNKGQGLTFNFAQFNSSWRAADPIGKGEWLQSHFVIKTLKMAFPQANFTNHNLSKSEKGTVDLFLHDSRENGKDLAFLDANVLDMRLIKAANTTVSYLRRDALRKTLGIKSDTPMVSLYMFNGFKQLVEKTNNPTMETLALELLKKRPDFQIMTLSSNDKIFENINLKKYIETNFVKLREKFDEIIFLSELAEGGLSSGKKILLINDVVGFVSHLHGASDLIVIKGPINLFEGLMNAVPTLIFNNRDTLDNFDKTEYFRQEAIAINTNRAVSVRSLSLLSDALNEVLNLSASFVSPADVITEKRSAEQRYLNHVEVTIRYALEELN